MIYPSLKANRVINVHFSCILDSGLHRKTKWDLPDPTMIYKQYGESRSEDSYRVAVSQPWKTLKCLDCYPA